MTVGGRAMLRMIGFWQRLGTRFLPFADAALADSVAAVAGCAALAAGGAPSGAAAEAPSGPATEVVVTAP